MPIRVKCSGCDKSLKVADKFAGGRIRCPGCQTIVAVPEASDSADLSTSGDPVPPAAASTSSSASSTKSSTADDPDDWLFGNETRAVGAKQSPEPERIRFGGGISELCRRESHENPKSTFVSTRDASSGS